MNKEALKLIATTLQWWSLVGGFALLIPAFISVIGMKKLSRPKRLFWVVMFVLALFSMLFGAWHFYPKTKVSETWLIIAAVLTAINIFPVNFVSWKQFIQPNPN